MILFDLQCSKGHVFEAWFRDAAAYGRQVKSKAVACPICRNKRITKAPMAPNLASGKGGEAETATVGELGQMSKAHEALRAVREIVEKHFDHVGERFPEEARKIHYGETEKRNIYGEASEQEAQDLNEEGIEFGRLPWPRRHDS